MRVLDKKLWPAMVVLPFTSVEHSFKIQKWCKENIGEQHQAWHLTSPAIRVQNWHFSTEENAVLFKLRWS